MPGFWRIGGRDIAGRAGAAERAGIVEWADIAELVGATPGLGALDTLEVGRSPG